MCDESLEQLLADLDRSEILFAQKYLEFREIPVRTDREGRPTQFLSIEDARANAVLFLRMKCDPPVEIPETLRYRIHNILGIERAVDS